VCKFLLEYLPAPKDAEKMTSYITHGQCPICKQRVKATPSSVNPEDALYEEGLVQLSEHDARDGSRCLGSGLDATTWFDKDGTQVDTAAEDA
jgi:hypothetical protein